MGSERCQTYGYPVEIGVIIGRADEFERLAKRRERWVGVTAPLERRLERVGCGE